MTRLRYRARLWRATLGCLLRGHLIVGLGRSANNSPYYCWKCFFEHPREAGSLRDAIGALAHRLHAGSWSCNGSAR